ncbi:MAG: hypothetical protein E7223_04815 [Clostridiales bacterium]|nr:hypothetical protein [Clostridiales bacterium]
MEIIRETLWESPYNTRAFREYYGGLNWAVLDIESTGLDPKYTKCILVGVVFPGENCLEAVQILANSRQEEPELLEALNGLLEGVDMLVTYNGRKFDIPYLQYRFEKQRVPQTIWPCSNLDIYRAANKYSLLRQVLPNLRQPTVEAYMGLRTDRTDQIDGGESVRLYEEFETYGNAEDREKILLHNRDDIAQLSRLMALLDKLDLHRILHHEGFPVVPKPLASGPKAYVQKITPDHGGLRIEGACRGLVRDYYAFETGYEGAFKARQGTFTLFLPMETLEGAHYVDLSQLPEAAVKEVPEKSPALAGNYLILYEKEQIHYREINALVRGMVRWVLEQQ